MPLPLELVVLDLAPGPERLSLYLHAHGGRGVEHPALVDVLDLGRNWFTREIGDKGEEPKSTLQVHVVESFLPLCGCGTA